LSQEVLNSEVFLFSIKPAVQKQYPVFGNYELQGDSHLLTPNEPEEIGDFLYLKNDLKDKPVVKIYDESGHLLKQLEGKKEAGLHRLGWEMRKDGQGRRRSQLLSPGRYKIVLEAGEAKLEQTGLIKKRLSWSLESRSVVLTEFGPGESN